MASALIVRHEHLFCTLCYCVEPINPGVSGTPINTYILALQMAAARHPNKPHADPFKDPEKK